MAVTSVAIASTFAIFLFIYVTSADAVYCSSRDKFTNVCIEIGYGNQNMQQVFGAKACDGKTMTGTFEILWFDYCQPNSDPCLIIPNNSTRHIQFTFTSGGTVPNETTYYGNVTLRVAGAVQREYSYTSEYEMSPNTRYTIRADWDPSIPTPVCNTNVQYEFNMFNTIGGLILCIEGTVVVKGSVNLNLGLCRA